MIKTGDRKDGGVTTVLGCFVVSAIFLTIQGCSLLAHNEQERAKFDTFQSLQVSTMRLAAEDLTAAFVQIPDVAPRTTTLEVPKRTTEYGDAVVGFLSGAGYTIRKSNVPSGDDKLIYSESRSTRAGANQFTAKLGYRDILLTRDYAERETGLFPVSPLRVSGNSSPIRLNEACLLYTSPSPRDRG